MAKILTDREIEIIDKKTKGISLSQNESNILSKNIRPKLKEMQKINSEELLIMLEYNQKNNSIEKKIKEIILADLQKVSSIILYGSVIQTNYKEYNDIDVLIITKDRFWNSEREKYDTISDLTKKAKKENLNLDIQIIDKESFDNQYPHNPSLIYQLKDCKVIYGKIKIPNKIVLSSLGLRMKLDWSDIANARSNGDEIYHALRNAFVVFLLMNKKIDNDELKRIMDNLLGPEIVAKLKNNKATKEERGLALNYMKLIVGYMEKELLNPKWEKIEIFDR